MKKTTALFILTLLCLSVMLISCGGDSDVVSDVPVVELSTAVDGLIANGSKLSAVDGDYVKGSLELDTALLEDYILKIQVSGTEIDQYGIFKAADEANIEAVENALNSYLDTMRTNWGNFNYLPEEKVKLDNSSVETIGSYVVFTILSEDESTAVIDRINEMLTAK